jgi:hypothetical protein
MPGTLTGKRMPAVMPEIPAPITATWKIQDQFEPKLSHTTKLTHTLNDRTESIGWFSSAKFGLSAFVSLSLGRCRDKLSSLAFAFSVAIVRISKCVNVTKPLQS